MRVLELPGLSQKGDASDWLAAGGTADELRELADATPEATIEGDRPKLLLIGGKRPEILRDIEVTLRDPSKVVAGWIFSRGLAPAALRYSVDATKLRAGKVEITLPPRSAYLAAAKPEHVAGLLDGLFRFARFRAGRNGEPVEAPCDCPLDLARHALANASLLPLLSISRTPVLREDGSILDRPGYDGRTGIYYAPEIAFPAIPDGPTQEDARAALDRLRRPFRKFPFATDTDRDAVVAEVLTILTRHLVPRAPAFLHNATEAGSGKTKLFDTVSIVAVGGNAVLLNADILDDETELKKVLTTLTLAATPLVVFDNVGRGKEIRSPGLSNYLTATVYGDRLLGTNETVQAPTCAVIGMTGNGCEITGDNTRRILRIDLDAGVERPELREFDFDCETEAHEERGELIAAALTILRAHALDGWPRVAGRGGLGSFEDWDRLVCGALVFAGAPDILTLLEKTRTVDPERGRLVEVLRVLQGIGATGVGMKAGEIIRTVERVLKERAGDEDAEIEATGWLEVLSRYGKDGRPNSAALGRYLTRNKGRVVDDTTLIAEFDSDAKTSSFRVQVKRREGHLRGYTGVNGGNRSPFQSDVGAEENSDNNTAAYTGGPPEPPFTTVYPRKPAEDVQEGEL